MNRDPIFCQIAPVALRNIVDCLGWNPSVTPESGVTLSQLPLSGQLAWLDGHRTEVEDRISYVGTSSLACLLGDLVSYRDIVIAVAEKISVVCSSSQTTEQIEMAVVGKLWQSTLSTLSSEQVEALKVKATKLAQEHGQTYGIEVAGFAALGAAQLSGFGVYLLGSTLLGAINGALGLGLGFGAFTGLSSLISTVIGPVGWAALGLFTLVKLGAPNYKKLLPVVILVTTQRYIVGHPEMSSDALRCSLPASADASPESLSATALGVLDSEPNATFTANRKSVDAPACSQLKAIAAAPIDIRII